MYIDVPIIDHIRIKRSRVYDGNLITRKDINVGLSTERKVDRGRVLSVIE